VSIRWYALTPTGLPVYCHGEPVIFHAPCKLDAIQLIVERWPGRFGLKAMSVCEYEAVQEMTSAATRAKAHDDALLAMVKTWPVPEDEEDEGQYSLCADVAMWRAA
jgi:hypothetical protein